MGETLKPSQLDALLRKIDDDRSGDISFQEFCQMVFWMRRAGVGAKLGRAVQRFRQGMKKLSGMLGKKKMSEEERIRRKLGPWEMHVNPNIGNHTSSTRRPGNAMAQADEVLPASKAMKEKFTEQKSLGSRKTLRQ